MPPLRRPLHKPLQNPSKPPQIPPRLLPPDLINPKSRDQHSAPKQHLHHQAHPENDNAARIVQDLQREEQDGDQEEYRDEVWG